MPYDQYPAVDEDYNFPPPIREQLFTSPEFADAFAEFLSNNPYFAAKVNSSRKILTGSGLKGGGDLSMDRTLSVDFHTQGSSNKVVRADDPRLDADDEGYLYEQSFAIASSVWTVVHNQNTKGLSVYTENSLGQPLNGDVTYPNANTIQISFYYPQTGVARVFN